MDQDASNDARKNQDAFEFLKQTQTRQLPVDSDAGDSFKLPLSPLRQPSGSPLMTPPRSSSRPQTPPREGFAAELAPRLDAVYAKLSKAASSTSSGSKAAKALAEPAPDASNGQEEEALDEDLARACARMAVTAVVATVLERRREAQADVGLPGCPPGAGRLRIPTGYNTPPIFLSGPPEAPQQAVVRSTSMPELSRAPGQAAMPSSRPPARLTRPSTPQLAPQPGPGAGGATSPWRDWAADVGAVEEVHLGLDLDDDFPDDETRSTTDGHAGLSVNTDHFMRLDLLEGDETANRYLEVVSAFKKLSVSMVQFWVWGLFIVTAVEMSMKGLVAVRMPTVCFWFTDSCTSCTEWYSDTIAPIAEGIIYILCCLAIIVVVAFERVFRDYLEKIEPYYKFWGAQSLNE